MKRKIEITNHTTPASFLTVLALIFITLKLTGYITWSWWLVLLPLYGPWVLILGLLMIVFAIVGTSLLFKKIFS